MEIAFGADGEVLPQGLGEHHMLAARALRPEPGGEATLAAFLPDNRISRRHGVLSFKDGHLAVNSLGSDGDYVSAFNLKGYEGKGILYYKN